jgi:hypothetical protein
MIIIYPLLVSENTNMNMLPPICKVLEKYILVYRMEDVLSYMRGISIPLAMLPFAAKTKESMQFEQPTREPPDDWDEDEGKKDIQRKRDKEKKEKEYEDLLKKKRGSDKGGQIDDSKSRDRMQKAELGTVAIDTPRNEKDITLEPTWVKMSHPKLGSIIVGVKVVPFKVKSEYNYIQYLLNDINSKFIESMVESTKRKFIRIFWSLARKIPFLSRTLTGDPSKDVFFASTVHRHNVFCLFNYMDLSETDLLSNTSNIAKLFQLGWNSLVLADDVNKRVTFCMKEFHGLCSSVPFPYIKSSFGKDYQKTFEDMEDIRKSASPFFRFSGGNSLKKLMAAREGKMANNDVYKNSVTNYLDTMYEHEEKEY